MKKILVFGLIIINMLFLSNIAFASAQDNAMLRGAIQKYKERNFIGSISDLKMITEKDPANAVAWYYLANSYMCIALKSDAHKAFDKVVQLNTVPQLTSYSVQAKLCMENAARCDYLDLNLEQIEKLRENPVDFIDKYLAEKAKVGNPDFEEIDKLIEGDYDQVHPQAKEFIDQEKLKMQQAEININKAYVEDDNKVAQIMEFLQKQNDDLSRMTMLMDNKSQNNSNYEQIMKYIGKSDNKEATAQMLQLMMMQNSMMSY